MNIPYVMKKCSKCGEWLVASNINFYKDKTRKYGLKGQCKECHKEYREENKDKIKECKRKYYEKNKEYYKEYNKEYYEKNKDEINKRHKEYYEKNKEYYKEYNKEYYKEYKERYKEWNKEWNEKNPEKRFNKHNKRRSKIENRGRGVTKEQWNECLKWFDWKCAYSGEKIKKGDKSTYGRTVDHIVALENKGLNEPWNLIPMRKGDNSSKKDKINSLDWYMKQEYFDIERLNKIVEWQIYAYEKWGGEEFGELILITDLVDEVKNYE